MKRYFSKSVFIALFAAAVIMTVVIAVDSMMKNITIVIDGKEQVVSTFKDTVEEVLEENGITIAEKDKLSKNLYNIFENIILNAVKFSDFNTEIKINVYKSKNNIITEIIISLATIKGFFPYNYWGKICTDINGIIIDFGTHGSERKIKDSSSVILTNVISYYIAIIFLFGALPV